MGEFASLSLLTGAAIGALPTWDSHRFRLTQCRRWSRCGSNLCPTCSFAKAFKRRDVLHGTASTIAPKRLRLITLNGADQPLESLRECSRQMMTAARQTLKNLKVPGAALKLESSFLHWDKGIYHPHAHLLADTPTGGRGFIPAHAWGDEFFERLPNCWHPTADHVDVSGTIDSVFASASYLTKSPFHGASTLDVARIVAAIDATAGLQQYVCFGTLRAA
jgi:hypothetical protein